jgi:hypothetical protein
VNILVVMTCSLVAGYQCYEEICCLLRRVEAFVRTRMRAIFDSAAHARVKYLTAVTMNIAVF